MRLVRVRRLIGRAVEELAREADVPEAVIYLPDNRRGDLPPGRYGAVVIYDPDNPPPEIRDDEPVPR